MDDLDGVFSGIGTIIGAIFALAILSVLVSKRSPAPFAVRDVSNFIAGIVNRAVSPLET